MKYLTFNEYDWKDVEKVVETWKKVLADREKEPEKFPRTLFPNQILGTDLPKLTKEVQAVTVYEVENDYQAFNLPSYFVPFMTFKYVPISSGRTGTEMKFDLKR